MPGAPSSLCWPVVDFYSPAGPALHFPPACSLALTLWCFFYKATLPFLRRKKKEEEEEGNERQRQTPDSSPSPGTWAEAGWVTLWLRFGFVAFCESCLLREFPHLLRATQSSESFVFIFILNLSQYFFNGKLRIVAIDSFFSQLCWSQLEFLSLSL